MKATDILMDSIIGIFRYHFWASAVLGLFEDLGNAGSCWFGFKCKDWRRKSFFEEGWLGIDFSYSNVIIIKWPTILIWILYLFFFREMLNFFGSDLEACVWIFVNFNLLSQKISLFISLWYPLLEDGLKAINNLTF